MLEFDLTDLHQAPEWHHFVKQALVCVCVCVSSAVAGQDWLKCFEWPQFSDRRRAGKLFQPFAFFTFWETQTLFISSFGGRHCLRQ